MTLHLTLLILFAGVQVGLGLWVGRRVSGSAGFFVAGRSLSAPLLFSTVLAANIGAGSTVGAASLGYRDGLSAWWWNGSAALGSLVLAWWAGPRLWALARQHGCLTLGDLLETRYGALARGTASAVLWVGTIAILSAQLIGAATILHVVAGMPRWAGAAVGGAVMVTYFVAGGLLSAVWVNITQLVVVMAGFLVATPLAVAAAGGWSSLVASPALPAGHLEWLRPWPGGLSLLPLLAPAFIVSPGLVQKVYGARDAGVVRTGVGWNGVVLLGFAFLPAILGLVARVKHPGLPTPDLALPTVLAHDLPPLVGALALSAVFAAEVSSADAILFMLATSLSQDLYRRFVNPEASDGRVVAVARGAALAGGLAGIGAALWLPTVISALEAFYSLLTVLLFVPVLGLVVSARGGSRAALASMAIGTLAMGLAHVLTAGAGWGPVRPATFGIAASAAAFLAARAGTPASRTS